MEAYGTGWEERHQCGNTDKKNHSLTGNHEIVSLPQQTPRRRYIFISVFGNPLINMQASEGRVRVKRVRGSGGGKTNMRGWGYSPSIRCSAGQGAPPPVSSRCCTRALWSCCHGDVGQGADVQAQRGFGAGSGVQTAQAGAGSKLRLNLGHRDPPEQTQTEA